MSIRCRMLVVLGLLGASLGMLREQDTLVVLSLALLFWIFGTWALLSIRISLLWPGLALRRTLNGVPADRVSLWSDRSVSIQVLITSSGGKLPALCTLDDWLPESLQLRAGSPRTTVVRPVKAVELSYECQVLAAGQLELPGIHFQFRDHQGLFVTERFLEQPSSARSLPSFARVGETRPSVKRINSLPQHGVHRLQRAGLGSELLELREYQPGDPPKSIAWKVSARRDRLMTRQYESEVPVRITLFVDGSDENRWGGFGLRQLDQVNYLAASAARAAISAGDALGLVVLNSGWQQRLSPAFGERAFFRVLDALSACSSLPPQVAVKFSASLQKAAVEVAQRRYPELMRRAVNRVPWTWLPLWPWKRSAWRKRVQLSGLLGMLYDLNPQATCALYWDDRRLAELSSRFLWEQGWAWMAPLYSDRADRDESGDPPAPPPAGAELMRAALTKSVVLAKDNEVFVVIANLFNRESYVEHILPAVKMAVARHHRVVILCTRPWPTPPISTTSRTRSSVDQQAASDERRILLQAQAIEIDNRLVTLKRKLRKVGAKVAIASERNAISLVLAEAELAGRGLTVGKVT